MGMPCATCQHTGPGVPHAGTSDVDRQNVPHVALAAHGFVTSTSISPASTAERGVRYQESFGHHRIDGSVKEPVMTACGTRRVPRLAGVLHPRLRPRGKPAPEARQLRDGVSARREAPRRHVFADGSEGRVAE